MPRIVSTPARKPRPLGQIVKPWGKIGAIGFVKGERYYFLIDREGSVSMMPADVVERARRQK
jgi:hypothetical protein